MRYIEFLEALQTRNDCNQKLWRALDQVDSNLSSISMKMDKLTSKSRQDESPSSLKNWYINGKADSSVGSAVEIAPRNNNNYKDKNAQQEKCLSTKKHETLISVVRTSSIITDLRHVGSATVAQQTQFPCKEKFSNFNDDIPRPEIPNYENSEMLLRPLTFNKGESCTLSYANTPNKVLTLIDEKIKNSTQENLFEPSSQEFRIDYSDLSRSCYESTSTRSPLIIQNGSLPSSFSRELVNNQPDIQKTPLPNENVFKRIFSHQNRSIFDDDDVESSSIRPSSTFFKAGCDSGRRQDDEDEGYDVDDTLGNHLERYMSRIPKLYPNFPQNLEKLNLERNRIERNSLDNVDLSSMKPEEPRNPEERPKIGQTLSLEFETFSDRSKQVSTSETGRTTEENLVVNRSAKVVNTNKNPQISSDVKLSQLSPPITLPSLESDIHDDDDAEAKNSGNNENIELITERKNKLDCESDDTSSESRSSSHNKNSGRSLNNHNQAYQTIIITSKQTRSTEEKEEGSNTELQGKSVKENVEIDDSIKQQDTSKSSSTDRLNHENSKYKIVSGEERNIESHLHEYVNDLTTFDLNALEINVRESTSWKNNREPNSDSIKIESEEDIVERTNDHEREIDNSEISGASDHFDEDEKKIEACVANGKLTSDRKISWDNDTESISRDKFEVIGEAKHLNLENDYPDREKYVERSSNEASQREQYDSINDLRLKGKFINDSINDVRLKGKLINDSINDVQLKEKPGGINQYQGETDREKDNAGNSANSDEICTTDDEKYIDDDNQQYTNDPNKGYSRESNQYQNNSRDIEDSDQTYGVDVNHGQSDLPEVEEFVNESEDKEDFDRSYETSGKADFEADRVKRQLNSTRGELDHNQDCDNEAAHELQTSIHEAKSTSEYPYVDDLDKSISFGESKIFKKKNIGVDKTDEVLKLLLDSDTESALEQNVSNAESDFDFN